MVGLKAVLFWFWVMCVVSALIFIGFGVIDDMEKKDTTPADAGIIMLAALLAIGGIVWLFAR